MGIISRGFDRLPTWGEEIFYILSILGCVYCISEYGFWSFLLRVVFSPVP
jgi:hypothetical protein